MARAAKKTVKRKTSKHAAASKRGTGGKLWSGAVTKHSNALDLDSGVFTWKDPRRIAASLKRSAEASSRRKADPYRSALSMLTFYINGAGKNLPETRKDVLRRAKIELRAAFGRDP
jgi:Protein of unknown function (DUF3175)